MILLLFTRTNTIRDILYKCFLGQLQIQSKQPCFTTSTSKWSVCTMPFNGLHTKIKSPSKEGEVYT